MAAQADPTEEPTPQRLLKARQRGQVAVSRDFSAALSFVALMAILVGAAPAGWARLVLFFRRSLETAAAAAGPDFPTAGAAALRVILPVLAVPLGGTMAVAILIGAMQTGGLFAWQAARPDIKRLSPAAGLKRLMGPRTLIETAKALLKITVVLLVAGASLGWGAGALLRLAGARPSAVLAAMGVFSERLGIRVAMVLVTWGLIDWLLARRRHRRSLMMTREEVKREYKDAEGDPRHRLERQRLHREISEQRMVEEVRKADFVVVNPEHIAVAVKYDRDADAAPTVVAKGERLLAERIKQVAREAGVPIYRDVGLARSLSELPEGEEIPEVLYEAVAELLRVLWEIDNGSPGVAGATSAATGSGPANSTTGSEGGDAVQAAAVGGADASPGRRAATSLPLSASSTWKRV